MIIYATYIFKFILQFLIMSFVYDNNEKEVRKKNNEAEIMKKSERKEGLFSLYYPCNVVSDI